MCGVYVHVVWSCARVSRVRVWVTAASVCVRATYTARARGAFAQCNLHYRLSLIMSFFWILWDFEWKVYPCLSVVLK